MTRGSWTVAPHRESHQPLMASLQPPTISSTTNPTKPARGHTSQFLALSTVHMPSPRGLFLAPVQFLGDLSLPML
jgi:hypothetical protein